jgi:hypothetical protein
MAQSLVIPLAGFPLPFSLPIPPFPQIPLTTWNPSFCVVRSHPPWSQVARKLTSPSPFQFPDPPGASPNQLCALLRRHHDPGFT